MTKKLENPPSAANLIVSLCSMGYTLSAAVADLIDNSIAAGADKISIRIDPQANKTDFCFRLEDNGCGMTRDELLHAMRIGSSSPLMTREESDLGRFGLGLKSASFSQSDRLIVRSVKDGRSSCFEWNLQEVAESDAWQILEHDSEGANLPYWSSDVSSWKNGTAVYWPQIRSFSGEEMNYVLEQIRVLEKHLGLTFHRYIEDGDFTLFLNGRKINAIDPFYETDIRNPRQYRSDVYPQFSINPQAVSRIHIIHPSVLQEDSRFTDSERYSMQGFWIYRSKRLLISGGWLGMRGFPLNAESSLARVKVEFSNKSDENWKLNIMKNSAVPPRDIRIWLQNCARVARAESETVMKKSQLVPVKDKPYVRSFWRKERGMPEVLNTEDPIVGIFLEAVERQELKRGMVRGFMRIFSLGHPSNSKKIRAELPGEAEKAAVSCIIDKLKVKSSSEEIRGLLFSYQPFKYWEDLLSELIQESVDVGYRC